MKKYGSWADVIEYMKNHGAKDSSVVVQERGNWAPLVEVEDRIFEEMNNRVDGNANMVVDMVADDSDPWAFDNIS